jgi:hypothetical protein
VQGEAALVTEADVDQHDIRPKLFLESERFRTRRRKADNSHTFSLEQQARSVEKGLVVVNDEAANLHPLSIPQGAPGRVDANRSRQ